MSKSKKLKKSFETKRLGVTGGIGSGKTTVCKIFEILGIPVYYSDARAKEIINNDKDVISAIVKHFGKEAYIDKKLNREYISKIVFNNPDKLKLLNAIVHPAVYSDEKRWNKIHNNVLFTLYESALLFEIDKIKEYDGIITVYAPDEICIQRVIKRSELSEKEVIKRIESQMDPSIKLEKADYKIVNDGKQSLIIQVYRLFNKLNSKFKN